MKLRQRDASAVVSVMLKGLCKRFGDVRAVDNVSLHIERGEFFFLLGPSGCGKTTLLRMMAGLCEIEAGELLFDGKRINDVPTHKRNVGMVFQNYALWPHMSVAENVAYGLDVRRVRREEKRRRVTRALELVRMDAYAERKPNQLSGGQQQRVAVARALVIEPDLILLDEPLSNLDAKLRNEMRQELRRIHRETGITTIYVTHDQKEALSLAGRLAVMSMGRVEQCGTPREIYNTPANVFVAEFIGQTNLIRGKVMTVDREDVIIAAPFGKIRAHAPERAEPGKEVVCSIRPEALRVGADGVNRLRCRVEDRTYMGDSEELTLAPLRGRDTLRATITNPGREPLQHGEEVSVSFDAQDVVLLSE